MFENTTNEVMNASLEIIIMLIGAFLLGILFARLFSKKAVKEKPIVQNNQNLDEFGRRMQQIETNN